MQAISSINNFLNSPQYDRASSFLVRITLGSLAASWAWNYMYTTFYLHGYVWAMHQQYNYSATTYGKEGYMGEGSLMLYQHDLLPLEWQTLLMIAISLSCWIWLRTINAELTVWKLWCLNILMTLMMVVIRAMNEGQKILVTTHTAFAYNIILGLVGFVLTFKTKFQLFNLDDD